LSLRAAEATPATATDPGGLQSFRQASCALNAEAMSSISAREMRTWLAMTNQQFNATAAEQAAFNPVELIDRTQIERMLLKCRITDHGSRITDLTSMSFLSIVFNS
jgi:hypothetical protein